jgi:hypothetical protein
MAVIIAAIIFAIGFQLFFKLQLRNEIWAYVITDTTYNRLWGAVLMAVGAIFFSLIVRERIRKRNYKDPKRS